MRASEAATVAIDVSVEDVRWLAECRDAAGLAEATAAAALAARPRLDRSVIVGIVLTDDAEQRALNRTYRGRDEPTNILSFALDDGTAVPAGEPLLLGDIVLAFETVAREAAEQHKPLPDHLRHLVVHGVLHLLGFDHEDDAEAQLMEACEIEILTRLGVPDPYRDIM